MLSDFDIFLLISATCLSAVTLTFALCSIAGVL